MMYVVQISDTTGFDVIGDRKFDNLDDVMHYLKSILPYVDYYEYTAWVDTIDDETGEILSQDEYAWCVTNCGSFICCDNKYTVTC